MASYREMLRVEIYSGPDHRGRYHYALFGPSDYTPGHPDGEDVHRETGQHYLGNPDSHGVPLERQRDMRHLP